MTIQPLRPHPVRQGAGVETGRNHYDRLRPQEARRPGHSCDTWFGVFAKRLDTRVNGENSAERHPVRVGHRRKLSEWIASRRSSSLPYEWRARTPVPL